MLTVFGLPFVTDHRELDCCGWDNLYSEFFFGSMEEWNWDYWSVWRVLFSFGIFCGFLHCFAFISPDVDG